MGHLDQRALPSVIGPPLPSVGEDPDVTLSGLLGAGQHVPGAPQTPGEQQLPDVGLRGRLAAHPLAISEAAQQLADVVRWRRVRGGVMVYHAPPTAEDNPANR